MKRPWKIGCVFPAEIFGLPAGSQKPGEPADMVLIDPDECWQVHAEEFASLSRNCPYEGWDLKGRTVGVLVGGRLVYRRGSLRVGRGCRS